MTQDAVGYDPATGTADPARAKKPGKKSTTQDDPASTVNVTQKDGYVYVEDRRVPSARELEAMYPIYTEDERINRWAQESCALPDQQATAFCGAAVALGLVTFGQSTFDKMVTGFVVSLVAPDVDAWKSCLSGDSVKSCGSAALDLPLARVFKGAKALKACNSFVPGTEVLMADGGRVPLRGVSDLARSVPVSRASATPWNTAPGSRGS